MKSNSGPGSVLAGGGAIAGLAALIGASCCALPILLVQLGVSTALVAQLGFLADAKPYLLAAAAVLLVVGFVVAFWGGRKQSRGVLALLVAGTLLVFGALVAPHYERELLEWTRSIWPR